MSGGLQICADHGSEEPRRPLEPRRSLDLSAGDTQSISELLGESQLSRLQSKVRVADQDCNSARHGGPLCLLCDSQTDCRSQEIHETDSGVADMPKPKTSPRAALHSTASCTGNGESVAIEMQAPEVPRRLGTHDSVQSTLGSLPKKASSNGLDVRWEEDRCPFPPASCFATHSQARAGVACLFGYPDLARPTIVHQEPDAEIKAHLSVG